MTVIQKRVFLKYDHYLKLLWTVFLKTKNSFSQSCSLLTVGLQDPIKVSVLFNHLRSQIEPNIHRPVCSTQAGPWVPVPLFLNTGKELIHDCPLTVLGETCSESRKIRRRFIPRHADIFMIFRIRLHQIVKQLKFWMKILNCNHVICNIWKYYIYRYTFWM